MKVNGRRFPILVLLLLGGLLSLLAFSAPSANVGVLATGISSQTTFTTPPLITSSSTSTVTSITTTTTTTLASSTSFSSTSTTTTTTTTSSSFSYTSTRTLSLTSTSTTSSTTITVPYTLTQVQTSISSVARSTSTFTLTSATTSASFPTCPVALATTGTPLEPYANFLRGFRNNQVQNTTAGRVFMQAFNGWYYSWAPSVSYEAASNPPLLALLRVGVYPLIGILYASYFSYVLVSPFGVEAGALAAGVVAASLIGLVYVAPVAYVTARLIQRRLRFQAKGIYLLPAAEWISVSAVMLAAAYLAGSAWLMALGTANLTLSMLATGSLLGARAWAFVQLPLANLHGIMFAAKRLNR